MYIPYSLRAPEARDRLATLSWIWNDLTNARGRRYSALLLVVILTGSLFATAQPYGIGLLFRGLHDHDMETLRIGVGALVGFLILEHSIGWLRQYVRECLFNVNFWHIPMHLTHAYFRQPLGALIAEDSEIDGGGVESTRDKVKTIQDHVLFTLLPGYSNAFFALGACFWVGTVFGAIVLVYCVIDFILSFRQSNEVFRRMEPIARAFRRWDRRVRNRWADVHTVKYNGVERRVQNELTKEIEKPLLEDFSVWGKWYPKTMFAQRVFGGLVRTMVYSYGAWSTLHGTLTIELMTLLVFSLERIARELEEISHARQVIQENMIRVSAYRDALTAKPPFVYDVGMPFDAHAAGVSITLSNVSLCHTLKSTHIPILRDVSLHIEHGERVAIVGPSGSGKSQLTNLILRAYDPTSGTVCVNGRDLRLYALESFCRVVGHVPQGAEVFEGSIRENVCFGLSERDLREVTDNAIWEAIRKAGLQFGDRLVDGLDTQIGYRGMRLSGGERQRLTIARAHIKKPKLVIADEATSALDSLSEAHVLDELYRSLDSGTTAILIAHRLSSLAGCTKIIFVRPLALCGEHDEQVSTYPCMKTLYASEPLFREMADQQGFVP